MNKVAEQKNQLRAMLLKQRLARPIAEQLEKSKQLVERLKVFSQSLQYQSLAAFVPFQGEINPWGFFEQALSCNINCYLPVLVRQSSSPLQFIQYQNGDSLIRNSFGILEPNNETSKKILSHHLDLVLVPLIGFDLQGKRLGFGQGYYDRTFSFLNKSPRPKQPYLLGVAYEFQEVDSLPTDDWDVALNGIMTENRFIGIP